MSNDSTPEGQPLDPHTLRVVLDKLAEQIARIEQGGAVDTDCSVEGRAWWSGQRAAQEKMQRAVSELLDAAEPRARVVVLPEPDEISADGTQAAWKRRGWGGYYVMADSELCQLSQAGHGTPECARARALAVLAAAEFAGGAK